MESKQIHILLDKFFEGQTTLEEDQLLKAYFQQERVEEAFAPYQVYFTNIHLAKTISVNKQFVLNKKPAVSSWVKRVASVAAVGVAVVWLSVPSFDTPTEEEIAYETFKENMLFVSHQLNRAEQDIAHINYLYDKPKAYLKYE